MCWATLTALGVYLLLHLLFGVISLFISHLKSILTPYWHVAER
jgi:hypothetical protein